MNILLTIHHQMSKNAGAPGVTYQLAEEYKKLGHEVTLFTFDDIPSYIPEKYHKLVFPVFLFLKIKKITKNYPLDVVDASSGDAWIWSFFRKARHKPALVTRSHGLEHIAHEEILNEERAGNIKLSWKYPIYSGGTRLWEVSRTLRKADVALVLNHYDWRYSVNKLKVKASSCLVVNNGLPEYFLNLPFQDSSQDEYIRIAQVGSYINRKGISYTAEALNSILKKYPKVEISFVGTGCHSEKVLSDYSPELHSRIKVISSFNHEDLPAILQEHHIKLFATLSEGFSLALIEAMACGLAPISTSTHGTMTILKNSWDGLIIPPRDPDAIENAIERLLGDRNLLSEIRKNAYQTAQKYKWNDIAKEAIRIYGDICKNKEKQISGL
jgi:glycosyltransferase involved in cell wall biosynthesis